MSDPTFTVLMPTHRRVDVIHHAIGSVLAQTCGEFELFIVGDGAAEGTREIVESFGDPRMTFFDLPKAPHYGYANRNAALKQSSGRYIAMCSDDDLLFPDHLERLRAALDDGATLAYSQALWVSTDGIAAPFLTNLENEDELAHFMAIANSIPASCFAYRADALESRDAWPEDIPRAADWELWKRILAARPEQTASYVDVPTVLHFAADWKQSRFSLMPQLKAYIELAEESVAWPSELRLDVRADVPEQAAYANAMGSDPVGWSSSVRAAARDLTVRVAWHSVCTHSSKLEMLANAENEASRLQAALADRDAENERLNTTLEELYARPWWKRLIHNR